MEDGDIGDVGQDHAIAPLLGSGADLYDLQALARRRNAFLKRRERQRQALEARCRVG